MPARADDHYGLPPQGGAWPLSLAVLAALLALWWAAARFGWVSPLFLPGPGRVWRTFLWLCSDQATGGGLAGHVLASLGRVLGAFLLAVAIALPLGLGMGLNRLLRAGLDPLLEFYRPLPPLAYLPLTVLWLGIGEAQKLLLLTLAMAPPLALAARAGVRAVAVEQLHAAYAMGASRRQALLWVVLPAALPDILIGLRIGLGFGWTTLVAAEMVAAERGLGQMVLNASNFLRTDIMMVGILVIGLIAMAFDGAMRLLARRLTPWHGKQ